MALFSDRFFDHRYRNYFWSPEYWVRAIKTPRRALQNLYALITHPRFYRISRNVEGLISVYLGLILYKTVIESQYDSRDVIEVGGFKGLSTSYLSLAAHRVGKRVKSFELFSGLPTVDNTLDASFTQGQFASSVDEYIANVKMYGRWEVVDLVVGDARETMLKELGKGGFSVAFLDVDVHEVTSHLLSQLQGVIRGGEIIIVHDAWSLGVRKAIDEFHAQSTNRLTESTPEKGTARLVNPLKDV